MKDRRMITFNLMIEKRHRLDQALRETLATQRTELAAAEAAADEKRTAAHDVRTDMQACDEHLDGMLSGRTAMSLPLFNQLQAYRGTVVERLRGAEAELKQAETEVERRSAALGETSAQIVRNEGQISMLKERVARLLAEAEREREDSQDEEIEEIMISRGGGAGQRGAGFAATTGSLP